MATPNSNAKFAQNPVKNISRSIVDRSNTLVTSFNAGQLIPIYCDDVLPGDTVTMDVSMITRMATPIYPVMDSAYIDLHWFFVPNRLVWDHWRNFCGESNDDWDENVEYQIPIDYYSPSSNTLSGYLGLPMTYFAGNPGWCEASALYRRAYQLIWNEWYRDQNLQDPVLIDTGDNGGVGDYDKILPVNKYHDYFTSCLPSPQKGADVRIPTTYNGFFPVVTRPSEVDEGYFTSAALKLKNSVTHLPAENGALVALGGAMQLQEQALVGGNTVHPTNLWTRMHDLKLGTINDLRQAFAVQRLLEADARGGTRYRELVKSHFGVDVGDYRVQVPEYLGGAHIPINVQQVVQMSSTADELSPLGETGAMSKTVHEHSAFTKSFVEHGILMCLASVRTAHSYVQGIPRMFNRRDRLDFYWPELANIGEQAVLVKEIYASPDNDVNNSVFGYQEAWADYRYKPNQITGGMAFINDGDDDPDAARQNLTAWHYGDYYASRPYLSDDWIKETDVNVGRTLAVQDTSLADQFISNFYFRSKWARPIPLYSIPGLTGHV